MQKIFSSLCLTCQYGAQHVLKEEISHCYPDLRFSYSRGAFSTWLFDPVRFKPLDHETMISTGAHCSENHKTNKNTRLLETVFGRSCILSMGKITCPGETDPATMTDAFWNQVVEAIDSVPESPWFSSGIHRIHVWQPDTQEPGKHRFEPGVTSLAQEIQRKIVQNCPGDVKQRLAPNDQDAWQAIEGYLGETCLDCIVVAPDEWWIGTHRVVDEHSRWPGGLLPLQLPSDAVSRAWLKFEEGLRWSGFPIGQGSHCVDIGSAPGGGSQALLARDAFVVGVDPAEMDPAVLAHPNFVHARGKISQLKRKLFRKARWLLTDMNVAPSYTLDALEELACRDDLSIRGMLFTLKLFDWKLATEIPDYVQRIRSWGFSQINVRQLQFNRQEVMVAASR